MLHIIVKTVWQDFEGNKILHVVVVLMERIIATGNLFKKEKQYLTIYEIYKDTCRKHLESWTLPLHKGLKTEKIGIGSWLRKLLSFQVALRIHRWIISYRGALVILKAWKFLKVKFRASRSINDQTLPVCAAHRTGKRALHDAFFRANVAPQLETSYDRAGVSWKHVTSMKWFVTTRSSHTISASEAQYRNMFLLENVPVTTCLWQLLRPNQTVTLEKRKKIQICVRRQQHRYQYIRYISIYRYDRETSFWN